MSCSQRIVYSQIRSMKREGKWDCSHIELWSSATLNVMSDDKYVLVLIVSQLSTFSFQFSPALHTLKNMFFYGIHWVTLSVVFLTGTNTISLFSLGYICGSFYLIWQGRDLYLKSTRELHVRLELVLKL